MARTRVTKLDLAREYRGQATASEAKAWAILRNRQLLGLKFRRQHVIDGFIVDFYCAEHRLVLEIDGEVHSMPKVLEYDKARTDHFSQNDLVVLRIKNQDVTRKNLRELIKNAIDPGRPSPLHEVERGQG